MTNYLIDHVLTIAKKNYFTELSSLNAHPNVRYVLELPYDYILFEFYDELYKVIYNTDTEINYEVARNPEMNQKVRQLGQEKESLLQPLYSHPSAYDRFGYRHSCIVYFLRIKKREYWVMEPGKPKPIDIDIIGLMTNFSNQVECSVKFKQNLEKNVNAYKKVLNDWRTWADKNMKINALSEIVFQEDTVKINITFENDFEDFLVVLIVMLYETRKKTSINLIRFA
ncbi:hypothetical protein [Nostoc sp. MS1]|uniref:hypothetical protein n=1 Tax=Nostoc sp. MS1 TaxID=2764711 RepID=UPI001CC47BC8|nr:hypothetical protein [Nostoc sp. MS1]BCL38133.1 hypothetical protein NSMS1_45800 [Nostoc sp. MS1]